MSTNTEQSPATDLVRVVGRPFGVDETGQPIDHGSGKLIVGAIERMQFLVGRRAEIQAPVGIDRAERDDIVARAESDAFDRLVETVSSTS